MRRRQITVAELKDWAIEHGYYDDIFTRVDLRLPVGQRVLRDEAEIEEWIDEMYEAQELKER